MQKSSRESHHCLSAKSSPIPEGSCRRGRPVPWTSIARNLLQRSPILDRRKTGSTGGLLMMMQFKKCSFEKISCVNMNISNKEKLPGSRASARQHQKQVAPLARQHQITKDLNTETLATEYAVLEYHGKAFEPCLGIGHPRSHQL